MLAERVRHDEAVSSRATESAASRNELVLTSKVVSLADVEGQLNGVSRLIVPRGAVVTPAARDLLRRRRIAVARRRLRRQRRAKCAARVCWRSADTKFEPAELCDALAASGIVVERHRRAGLTSVIDELCDAVVAESGMLGLLLTDKPAAALCLANRHRGVRAALAHDRVTACDEAVTSIGANLLMIDPASAKLVRSCGSIVRAIASAPDVAQRSTVVQDRLG